MTPGNSDLNAAFLVSTIFMVDTIFASAQHWLKTVLPRRLQTVVEVPLLHLVFGGTGFAGWYYLVPEYVLTYGFMATFASYCIFMRYWRVILPLFGVQAKAFAFQSEPGPQPMMRGNE